MLHSEFCAVWLSLSDVTWQNNLLSNIHVEQVPATLIEMYMQLFQYRLRQKGLKQFVLYL